MATSPTPLGPYVNPVPMGASLDPAVCPPSMHDAVPFSHQLDFPNCGPPSLPCNNSMRLDSDLFNDPLTGESFFAYACQCARKHSLAILCVRCMSAVTRDNLTRLLFSLHMYRVH